MNIKNIFPPVVIESHEENGVTWLLSFGGSNPEPGYYIELTEAQCWFIEGMIMKIDPNLLERAKEKQMCSKL